VVPIRLSSSILTSLLNEKFSWNPSRCMRMREGRTLEDKDKLILSVVRISVKQRCPVKSLQDTRELRKERPFSPIKNKPRAFFRICVNNPDPCGHSWRQKNVLVNLLLQIQLMKRFVPSFSSPDFACFGKFRCLLKNKLEC